MVYANPARPARRAPVFVWPDMEPAVTVFLAMGTQWRVGPIGLLGLEYQAIRPTAELLGKSLDPQHMVDLRRLEAAALGEFRKGRRR